MNKFEDLLRKQMNEISNQYATKSSAKEMVDKLGEEIAYDINQIETQIKE